jgi:hypothetical protein
MSTPAEALSTQHSALSTRSERELLLECARVHADAQSIRALIERGVDWGRFMKLAQRNLVLPLVHHQLNRSASESLPADVCEKLKSRFHSNAARNIYTESELCRILKAFESKGVKAVPFKGPTLARLAYGDLSLRRFIDLDIIVSRRDIEPAKSTLLSMGYELQPSLTRSQESVLLRTQHNLQFAREGGLLIVELHWAVVNRKYARSLEAEDIWGRLEKSDLHGEEVLSLSTEDLLLALSAHGTKHLWERLIWICDIAELIRATPELDWELALERAFANGLERMLLLGVKLASDLLGATVPENVRSLTLADPNLPGLKAFVEERLFGGAEFAQAGMIENIRFNMRVRRHWQDRARYYRLILSPTDGDIAEFALPKGATPLYYLFRPFRLLMKGNH